MSVGKQKRLAIELALMIPAFLENPGSLSPVSSSYTSMPFLEY
jgi:hypothetical protein